MQTEIDMTCNSKNASILIVDDHPVMRRGLALMIDQEPGHEVCGEAATMSEALESIPVLSPDLAIIDLSLGHEDGLELIKQLRTRWPSLLMLVVSMHNEKIYAERVLRAGAHGYVMKHEPPDVITEAIQTVLDGGVHFSKDMQSQMLRRSVGSNGTRKSTAVGTVSDRELAVLKLIGSGLGTRQIAEKLNLSVKTVESHRERIKKKLGLSSAPELSHYATVFVQQEPAA